MVIGLGMRILRPGIVQTDTVASIAMVEMVSPLIGESCWPPSWCRHIHGVPSFTGGNHGNQGYLSEIYQSECRGERVLAISKGTTLTVGIISIVLSLFNSSTVLMIQSNMVGVLGLDALL